MTLTAEQRETRLYAELTRAAAIGAPCPTDVDLFELLCTSSLGTVSSVFKRLERQALIIVERYQRGRRVTICANGNQTAPPRSTAPHWRNRPREIPAPARSVLQERKPDMASEIARWASNRGVPMAEALADLVFIGWEIERERG